MVKQLSGKKLTKALDQAIRDLFKKKYGNNPTCFVCGRKDGWFSPKTCPYGIQVGHYIARGRTILRWDLKNVYPQCLTKESKLRKFNGLSTSIKDIRIGDKLWGFDEKTLEKKLSIVEDTKHFLPKDLYRVDLENGSSFFCTGDHKVIINGQWMKIEQMLHNVTTYDILEL